MDRFGEEEIRAVTDVIRSGRLSSFYRNFLGGNKITEFEKAFADYHSVPFAISTSSGTSALHTALLACGIGYDDEVVTTPYSFVATASSILMCGATPVFADVDSYGNLSPESVEKSISKRTKAILPVHLLGRPAELGRLKQIADRHSLYMIEDCAQALSARYQKALVGTIWSDAAAFSFQETKTLTTGEGGMVITRYEPIARKCQEIRNHGEKYAQNPLYNGIGFNYRMTEIAAAIGLVQLAKLDMFNRLQVENAKAVLSRLPKGIYPKAERPHTESVHFIIDTTFDEGSAGLTRDELIKILTENRTNKGIPGCTIGKGYDRPLYKLPYIDSHSIRRDSTQTVEALIATSLWLDIHRFRSREETLSTLEQISEVIDSRPLASSA